MMQILSYRAGLGVAMWAQTLHNTCFLNSLESEFYFEVEKASCKQRAVLESNGEEAAVQSSLSLPKEAALQRLSSSKH